MRTDHTPAAARWKLARELGAHVAHALMFGFGRSACDPAMAMEIAMAMAQSCPLKS